jgi:hypothetical protein
MNSVQIEQKSYEMPPREGVSIAQWLWCKRAYRRAMMRNATVQLDRDAV